jgi:hypothetical protein
VVPLLCHEIPPVESVVAEFLQRDAETLCCGAWESNAYDPQRLRADSLYPKKKFPAIVALGSRRPSR